jgi:hypothetical protein
VGGFVLIQANALEEAIAIARECPVFELQNGHIEIRVIEEVRRPGTA